MGNTHSEGSLRARLNVGGAVAAAGIVTVALVTVPPGTTAVETPISVVPYVRAVQLATFTQPVLATPLGAVLSEVSGGGTEAAPAVAAILESPAGSAAATAQTAAPDFLIARTVATWILQPLISLGQALPASLFPFYTVLFYVPVGWAIVGVASLIDSAINTVLGWLGVRSPDGSFEAVDARATSFATVTDDHPLEDSTETVNTVTIATDEAPDPDTDAGQTPTEETEPADVVADVTEAQEAPAETVAEVETETETELTETAELDDKADADEKADTTEAAELSDNVPEPEAEPDPVAAVDDQSVGPSDENTAADADDNASDDSSPDGGSADE